MTEPNDVPAADTPHSQLSISQLLPNMMTIAAICAGITSIRMGVDGRYELAVQLILAAAILDGLDGRVARLLASQSKMGAELDSLADFLNFGVAPGLVLYFWALQGMPRAGWLAVLVYAICCVVRLARFNVGSKAEDKSHDNSYFTGVPSPAGALLVMLPMFVSFSFAEPTALPASLVGIYMVIVGCLMISRIPTWSFKTTKISRENVKYFLIGFAAAGAALLIYTWTALVVLCLGYIGTVVWALIEDKRKKT